MTNFFYDNTGLPTGKIDNNPVPSGQGAKFAAAAEWQTVMQALFDLRGVLKSGIYTGLAAQTADPAPAGVPNYFWLKDDGTLWFKYGGSNVQINGGGGGGSAGQMFSGVNSIQPADGSTTALVANKLTVVDAVLATSTGAILSLPAANSVAAGTAVAVKMAPTGSTGLVGYDGAVTGFVVIKPIGTDRLDGALHTDPIENFNGLSVGGSQVMFVSDGTSKWVSVGSQPFISGLGATFYDPDENGPLTQVRNPLLYGDFRLSTTTIGPPNGNNIVVAGGAYVFQTDSSGLVVTGFARQSPSSSNINVDGSEFVYYNASTGTNTIKHRNGLSSAANQIYTPGAVDLTVRSFSGIRMVYSTSDPFDVAPGWLILGPV